MRVVGLRRSELLSHAGQFAAQCGVIGGLETVVVRPCHLDPRRLGDRRVHCRCLRRCDSGQDVGHLLKQVFGVIHHAENASRTSGTSAVVARSMRWWKAIATNRA